MDRPEHPNPQFYREAWQNLNGIWDFTFDFGKSGIDRKLFEETGFPQKINVPFCPESKLSGVEYKDFMHGVWYMRTFDVPTSWAAAGHVFLHFGAADYLTHVYINQAEVGTHAGGYTSFQFDITPYIHSGENTVTVYIEDDGRDGKQPRGKQSPGYFSVECDYTRTTGIWQTVWLEYTPTQYIATVRFYPDPENGRVTCALTAIGAGEAEIAVAYEGKPLVRETLHLANGTALATLLLPEIHLWEPGHGRLYDVTLTFGKDVVTSYFGLRNVRIEGKKILINGKPVFQRLVLDQGFYPDGVYTAPNENALVQDIRLSMAAGFNGVRLHQKVFEARFLYHCDKLGYLAWGEYPNYGLDYSDPQMLAVYLHEWREAVERDFNHPSIIGWCPFNETWDYRGRRQWDPLLSTVYHMTKAWDDTRPCIDTSGTFHTDTDIFDVHDYEQSPASFAAHYENLSDGEHFNPYPNRQKYSDPRYKDKPFFVSEYGGTRWSEGDKSGWGYGNAPADIDEFMTRFAGLTDTLLNHADMCGFCYTQLYDIEQEINGLYTYDRKPKFDMEKIRAITMRKAKIEDAE